MTSISLQLAALCCWQSVDPMQQQTRLKQLTAQTVSHAANWQAIQAHRLWGLAARLIDDETGNILFGSFWSQLQQKAQQQTCSQLQLMAQSRIIAQDFQAADIALSTLKGPALSQRIYHDPAYRHSKDLDLLVAPADLWAATELLISLGFELEEAFARDPAQHKLIERHFWHLTFQHPMNRVIVELHWRIEPVFSPSLESQWQHPFPANQVSPDEFLYLIAHGARHHWFRLKWLGDIIAIHERNPSIWQQSKLLIQKLNMQDQIVQVLLIMAWLYPQLSLPDLGSLLLTETKQARFLANEAMRFLSEGNYPEVTDKFPLSHRFRILRYQRCLYQRYTMKEQCLSWLYRSLYAPDDIEALQFTKGWQWLYPWLRLPRLLCRWIKTRTQLHGH
ncbi:nucleotidyltransferase family protein [Tolumonas lignilytica]|uniref:nucleotidyltransferase family protein n=1 Tax=Tolumonas lignilytica TaxID=1283284 RepID=UPI0004662104|nr:nucleotidyltransferase family protein [Tolumonas lignilytica]